MLGVVTPGRPPGFRVVIFPCFARLFFGSLSRCSRHRVRWGNLGLRGNLGLFALSLLN